MIRPLTILCFLVACPPRAASDEKPRLFVLTDIGGDPDDQQSLVRLLTYANEFEIEGLVASASGTPGELGVHVVKPEIIRAIITAYGKVRDRLLAHSPDYPTASLLLERAASGNPRRGKGEIGADKDTDGSWRIVRAVDRADPRPLNVAIWGGSTDLAQALWRVRHERSADEVQRFVSKVRVHAIAHQDDTGPWIVANFPDLFYVLDKAPEGRDKREAVFRGMYLGGDESLTSRDWIERHVRTDHGALGALYPSKTWTAPNPHAALKEGDTPSWFYFLANGLQDPGHPDWGGWGGRFELAARGLHRDARDTVGEVTHARATVWRWREAYQNDFQARLDWCVSSFEEANHRPLAVVEGDRSRRVLRRSALPGRSMTLSARQSSDPDGDALSYAWWQYREAGTLPGKVEIRGAATPDATVVAPEGSKGDAHIILEVTDDGAPSLTSYRRLVLSFETRSPAVPPERDRR